MKEKILNKIKIILETVKIFSKDNPKTALVIFGIVIGLFIAFIF